MRRARGFGGRRAGNFSTLPISLSPPQSAYLGLAAEQLVHRLLGVAEQRVLDHAQHVAPPARAPRSRSLLLPSASHVTVNFPRSLPRCHKTPFDETRAAIQRSRRAARLPPLPSPPPPEVMVGFFLSQLMLAPLPSSPLLGGGPSIERVSLHGVSAPLSTPILTQWGNPRWGQDVKLGQSIEKTKIIVKGYE